MQDKKLIRYNEAVQNNDIPYRYYSDGTTLWSYIDDMKSENINDLISGISSVFTELSVSDVLFYYTKFELENGVSEEKILENLKKYETDAHQVNKILNNTDGIFFATYNKWVQQYDQELANDRLILDRMLNISIMESQYKDNIKYKIEINDKKKIKSKYIFKVKYRGTDDEIQIYDGLDIFNDCILSYNIPLLVYKRDKDTQLTKVYKGTRDDEITDYSNIIFQDSDIKDDERYYNKIFIKLYIGEGKESRGKDNKYIDVIFDLDKATINTYSIPESVKQSTLITIFTKAFPTVTIYDTKETSLNYKFIMSIKDEKLNVDSFSLYYSILKDDYLSYHIYTNDVRLPAYDRTDIEMNYISYTTNDGVPTQEDGALKNPSSADIKFTNSGDNVRVLVSYAEDMDVVNEVIGFLNILIDVYLKERGYTYEFYDAILGDGISESMINENVVEEDDTITHVSSSSSVSSNVKELKKSRIGEKLGSRLSGSCAHAPKIIEATDREKYEKMGIQILYFPVTAPEVAMVCDDKDYPYPGIKHNKGRNKSDEYRYIPCCYKTDHMNPLARSLYNDVKTGKIKEFPDEDDVSETSSVLTLSSSGSRSSVGRSSKTSRPISTNKILGVKQTGKLPSTINILLSPEKYLRYGVPETNDSFIHAIMIAVGYPEYLNSEDKENYVRDFRSNALTKVNMSLLKQEFYDITEGEIYSHVFDTDSYFNPELYYRLLEEIFDINIYMFTWENMLIPRNKLFCVRPYRPDRKFVMVICHKGNKLSMLDYNHTEIIITDKNKMIFDDPTLNRKIYDIFSYTNQLYTWYMNVNELVGNIGYFSDINYENIFGTPIGQYIDGYGKCRAVLLDVDGDKIYVFITPTQPFYITGEDTTFELDSVKSITYEICRKRFGEPIGISKRGCWYSIAGITYGIFIPTVTDRAMITNCPDDPLRGVNAEKSEIEKLSKLRRLSHVLWQIIKVLYILDNMSDDFYKRFNVVGSDLNYDITKLKSHIPDITNIDEGIQYFSSACPEFITTDGKINLHNNIYKDRLSHKLSEYKRVVDGLTISKPKTIERLYTFDSDFHRDDRTILFLKDKNYRFWRNQNLNQDFNSYIIEKLTYDIIDKKDPIIYRDNESGKMYIIQNVFKGDIKSAYKVSVFWSKFLINLGYDVENEENIEYGFRIYSISIDGGLIETSNYLSDNDQKSDKALMILDYGYDKFASILRLD